MKNTYAGTWSGGDHGGMLYGVIVHESRIEAESALQSRAAYPVLAAVALFMPALLEAQYEVVPD